MRNRAYLGTIAGKQKRQRDKRQGERVGTHTAGHRKPLHPAPPAPSGHDKRQAKGDHQPQTSTHFAPTFQKYISILPFLVSDFPEKTPSTPKNLFTFAPFG